MNSTETPQVSTDVTVKDSAGRVITLDLTSATLTIAGKKFHHTAVLTPDAVNGLADGFAKLAAAFPAETAPEDAPAEVEPVL